MLFADLRARMPEPINYDRRHFLGWAAMALLAKSLGIARGAPVQLGAAPPLRVESLLPSLAGATGWLNSQPLVINDLRGRSL